MVVLHGARFELVHSHRGDTRRPDPPCRGMDRVREKQEDVRGFHGGWGLGDGDSCGSRPWGVRVGGGDGGGGGGRGPSRGGRDGGLPGGLLSSVLDRGLSHPRRSCPPP